MKITFNTVFNNMFCVACYIYVSQSQSNVEILKGTLLLCSFFIYKLSWRGNPSLFIIQTQCLDGK